MLRKKNITLNNKKADGSEKLVMGDSVKIFFADETLEKFTEGKYKAGSESNGTSAANASKDSINRDEINAASDNNGQHIKNTKDNKNASYDYEAIYKPLDIVYENEDVLLINKPLRYAFTEVCSSGCITNRIPYCIYASQWFYKL